MRQKLLTSPSELQRAVSNSLRQLFSNQTSRHHFALLYLVVQHLCWLVTTIIGLCLLLAFQRHASRLCTPLLPLGLPYCHCCLMFPLLPGASPPLFTYIIALEYVAVAPSTSAHTKPNPVTQLRSIASTDHMLSSMTISTRNRNLPQSNAWHFSRLASGRVFQGPNGPVIPPSSHVGIHQAPSGASLSTTCLIGSIRDFTPTSTSGDLLASSASYLVSWAL